jgi:hypothetical protein
MAMLQVLNRHTERCVEYGKEYLSSDMMGYLNLGLIHAIYAHTIFISCAIEALYQA